MNNKKNFFGLPFTPIYFRRTSILKAIKKAILKTIDTKRAKGQLKTTPKTLIATQRIPVPLKIPYSGSNTGHFQRIIKRKSKEKSCGRFGQQRQHNWSYERQTEIIFQYIEGRWVGTGIIAKHSFLAGFKSWFT